MRGSNTVVRSLIHGLSTGTKSPSYSVRIMKFPTMYWILSPDSGAPIFLLYVIAENATKIAENLLDICDKFLYWIREIVVNFFKFSEIADEQYEKNKEKFKKDCWFAIQNYWEVNKVGINFRKLYESRIEEIEIQIKRAIGFKQWDKKAKLEIEKKRLLEKIKTF